MRKPVIGEPPSETDATVTEIFPAATSTFVIDGAVGTRACAPAGASHGATMHTIVINASTLIRCTPRECVAT